MRRSKQALSDERACAVLLQNSSGVLACLGNDGYPYAVPLNYVYSDERIYFHCAKSGHKLEAIAQNPKVSFAVIDEDTIVGAEYTSYYRSVVAFGKARIADADERCRALWALVEKYSSAQPEEDKQKTVERCDGALVVAIDIEQLSGKEAKEYALPKRQQG